MERKNSFVNSLKIATRGLLKGLLNERNSRIQLIVSLIVITYSSLLGVSKVELLVIVGLCFFIILLELINTSIEKLLDVLYPAQHDEIGLVKDIMSGVVLLGSIFAVIVGIIILGDRTLALLYSIIK